jgi:glucoamylase
MYILFIVSAFALHTLLAQQTKPVDAGPGIDAHWRSAAKNGFGTSTSLRSKVWFTLTQGILTEVFYPTVDTPNTESLQFVFCKNQSCQKEESMAHSLRRLDERSLAFQQVNTSADVIITKTYTTDPERPTVLIDLDVQSNTPESSLFVYYDPSLKNSGMHDSGWNVESALIASEANVSTALVSSHGFEWVTSTFARNDIQFTALPRNQRVEHGNVVQIGKLRGSRVTLALGFGASPAIALLNARTSLRKGFAKCQQQYATGWHSYLQSLPTLNGRYGSQLQMAAMVLKALEDKTFRGAIIASPSTPWGGGPNANEPTVSGYHAVWSRDLYHIATALDSMGDVAAANRALDYLFKTQQRPDGSFPQNTWVDGRPIGQGLQMDQVALPIILAFQLRRTDRTTWIRHLKPAAEFIATHGPITDQDRWEEKPGYSPATIAAEISALVCAAQVARHHGDIASANRYREKAAEWDRNLAGWTATSNGPLGNGSYFLRLSERGDPSEPREIDINSGGGKFDQRSVVDMGFLELVRLGIRTSDDPLILRSLVIADATLKRETPFGPGWYRYNHDAYGERLDGGPYDGKTGVGRLWTLLTGERGEYELAAGHMNDAELMLKTMSGFANDGLMLPEQVWDRNGADVAMSIGAGTGSATPLAWSTAQFIRLAMNLNLGINSETPLGVGRELHGKK